MTLRTALACLLLSGLLGCGGTSPTKGEGDECSVAYPRPVIGFQFPGVLTTVPVDAEVVSVSERTATVRADGVFTSDFTFTWSGPELGGKLTATGPIRIDVDGNAASFNHWLTPDGAPPLVAAMYAGASVASFNQDVSPIPSTQGSAELGAGTRVGTCVTGVGTASLVTSEVYEHSAIIRIPQLDPVELQSGVAQTVTLPPPDGRKFRYVVVEARSFVPVSCSDACELPSKTERLVFTQAVE